MAFQASFSLFSYFEHQYVNICITNSNHRIRTSDLWCPKWPLCQLWHNHDCLKVFPTNPEFTKYQCDQIGLLSKAQVFSNFGGYFEKHHFLVKTTIPTYFWGYLVKFLGYFNSIIWSHCQKLTRHKSGLIDQCMGASTSFHAAFRLTRLCFQYVAINSIKSCPRTYKLCQSELKTLPKTK